ncbi:MAG: LysM peptidoglycan-binding domain-containing protein [Anaerolineales bacterium]|nr:LysM peptidoglycan-binding domain-containing protein [Anaerolineales bacterium]
MSLRPEQKRKNNKTLLQACLILVLSLSACLPDTLGRDSSPVPIAQATAASTSIPVPERPVYAPGELVDYTVQSGDTLPNLANRFNTSIEEILNENPVIPEDATTLPPGLPMQIPIYYEALWGSQFQIIPNCAFVNGPAQIDFDINGFIQSQPGWFKYFEQFAAEEQRSGAEIISYISTSFSISPKLLLAILEYQLNALSDPTTPDNLLDGYPLGYRSSGYHGLYIQLVWAANILNQGYYGWQGNHLDTLEFMDRTIEHPDPWQNSATVALQYYFSHLEPKAVYNRTINADGFLKTYQDLFGDPWICEPHIPGSLRQPQMTLPFESGKTWAFTGGPHTGWGQGDPWAALDFAPPSATSGCEITSEWAAAVAPGIIARSDPGLVELDLDGDGDHRTGWVILYLHLGTQHKIPTGTRVETGDHLGHPSCEGGESTGSHIHIARKYNGEWIPAADVIPFNLGGWIAHSGAREYQGTLTLYSEIVIASTDAEEKSLISSPRPSP